MILIRKHCGRDKIMEIAKRPMVARDDEGVPNRGLSGQ